MALLICSDNRADRIVYKMITLSVSDGFSEKIQKFEYKNTKVYIIFWSSFLEGKTVGL
jgi:hypothetical protein